MESTEKKDKREIKGITYSSLGIYTSFFILGILCTLVYQNATSEKVTLGTPEIINFVFSVALSTASTILAVAAISFGKASEKAMIDRSDESIKLQHEVFRLTTEALNRIQSSTGVTEKRIEDIISGRVGDISSTIAGAIKDNKIDPKNKAQLEKEIKESLLKEVAITESLEERELRVKKLEERRQREAAQRQYDEYLNQITLFLVNSKEYDTLKMGHGDFDGSGYGLFDGVYKLDSRLFGVIVFSSHPLNMTDTIKQLNSSDYFKRIFSIAREHDFHKIFIISEQAGYEETISRNLSLYNESIMGKIEYVNGTVENVTKYITRKMNVELNS